VSVVSVSVLLVASMDGPSQQIADEFDSLGTIRLMLYLGTPPGITVCDPWQWFPARALSVVADRFGSILP